MRTTIKTASGSAVVSYGEDSGLVLMTVKQNTVDGEEIVYLRMQPDQVGVLIFALEQASIQQAMGVAAKAKNVIAEKCEHGVRWERRCFACDEHEVAA